jgi:hypothetical protein
VFTRIGFLATKGGYLSISNSVSDFGTFAIIADGLFDEIYTTARPTQDYFSTVGSVTVNSAGSGYLSTPVVVIDPPTTPGGVQATGQVSIDPSTGQVTAVSVLNSGSGYDFQPTIQFIGGGFSVPATATVNLTTNQVIEVDSLRDQPQVGSIIQFEGDSTKYYVTSTDVTTQPFIYDEAVCRRDVRRIVDAVVGDMVMGTNYQAIAAGRSYLRSTSQVVLLQQLAPTIFGIEAARDEMLARIPDSNPANEDARYAIIEAFAIITDLITQGDSTARPDIDYNNLVTIDNGTITAKNNILANKEFIIEEVTKYIAEQFTDLSYNHDQWEQETTNIVIGTSFDVALGTNYNSVINGTLYARASRKPTLLRQKTQTLDSLAYLKDIILDLSNVAANGTATTRATDSLDEIIQIVTGLEANSDLIDSSALSYPEPTGVLVTRANAKDQLIANRQFIVDDVIGFITQSYPTLEYDEIRCARDTGYIVDALTYDVLYGGNSASRTVAESYYVGTIAQLGTDSAQITATQAAYVHLQDIVSAIVQGQTVSPRPGNVTIQDTSSGNASGVESDTLASLIQIIIDVIEAGNIDDLVDIEYPSISWASAPINTAATSIFAQRNNFATDLTAFILETFPDFTYDREKCKRDVGLIIDAIARDIRLNTNHNSIVAGLAYRRATASVVDQDQLPATLLALRYLGTLVEAIVASNATLLARVQDRFDVLLTAIEFGTLPSEGTTYPSPAIASQALIDSARQLQDNRAFLIEETIAWISDNYFIYDAAKCARDSQLILDAVALDLVLGTNYNSVTAGLAYYNATASAVISDQKTETIAAITHLRSQVATLIASSASSVTRTNAAFNEIIDIIQNGVVNADALTWTDPGINANKADARVLLQTNRTFIINDVISYINTNYPSLVYDTAKFQ